MAEEADIFGMNPADPGPSEYGGGDPPSAPPETPVPPESPAPAGEADAPAAEPEEGSGGQGEAADLIMGRWERTPEGYAQLEAAHSNLQAFATRESQRNAALESEMQRLLAMGPPQAGPMPGGYAPIPTPQFAPPQPQQPYPYGANGSGPAVELLAVPNFEEDPAAYAAAVQENARRSAMAAATAETARAQQEFAAASQQQQAEAQRTAYLQQVESTLGQWRSEHAITPNSGAEILVAQVCQGYGLPIHDKAALDFALEMTQNPALANAARATTEATGLAWAQSPEGRAYVRRLVPAAPASPPGSAGQQAFLEHGGSGAPIPGAPGPGPAPATDAWERAKAYAESRRNESAI